MSIKKICPLFGEEVTITQSVIQATSNEKIAYRQKMADEVVKSE